MKIRAIIASLLVVAVAGIVIAAAGLDAKPDQSYTSLGADAEPLRSAFNADVGKVRLLMYVSPTCGGCLRGASTLQKELLSEDGDSRLAVYVMWAPRNGARESHVDRVTRLVTDDRAAHYWDKHDVVGAPIDAEMELVGPCAGIFMLYGPEASWDGIEAPSPSYIEDAHADEFDRAGPQFDAKRFTSVTQEALAELP